MRAIVVFQREGSHPLGFLLHPEFKHCFACIDDGLYWIVVDGRDGQALVRVAAASGFDLAGYYRAKGFRVVEATAGPGIRGPLLVANCVGVVKAVLGIRCWAVTPWQLYRYLRKQ